MKLNNKGFAITTILYGTLILFMLLFVSLLGILTQYRKNMELLIDSTNGTRDVITVKPIVVAEGTLINCNTDGNTTCQSDIRNLYFIGKSCYKYLKINDTATCQ